MNRTSTSPSRRVFLGALVHLAGAALAVTVIGCGPPWQIVSQANPNPFVNQKKFGVLPVDFTGLRVGEKDEAGYLAEKDAEAKTNWAGDKVAMNATFAAELTKQAAEHGIQIVTAQTPADAPFMIRPKISWIEPGYYIGISARPSETKMSLEIISPDGKPLDSILIQSSSPASMTSPAVGNRLRSDAEKLGKVTGQYLNTRVNPEK